MVEAVTRILNACGTPESVLPPTHLFNEGWMLRLILDYLARHPTVCHPLAPAPAARWASEVLLPSQFLPKMRRDPRSESFTHADGVVGHFDLRARRGDITLREGAKQFMVLEAKMGSALSVGTKNAPDFDQAARNVACMAYVANGLAALHQTAFYVLAPASQVAAGVFSNLVTPESIASKVQLRCAGYDGAHDDWLKDVFTPFLARITLGVLTWETMLDALPPGGERDELWTFYGHCKRFNPGRGDV